MASRSSASARSCVNEPLANPPTDFGKKSCDSPERGAFVLVQPLFVGEFGPANANLFEPVNRRLHNQCFFASAALHALLVAIVIIAPAFLPEPPKVNTPVLNFRKDSEIEAILRAAETPAAHPPAIAAPSAPTQIEPSPAPAQPAPPAPTPPPPPVPAKKVEPPPPAKPVEKAPAPPPKPPDVPKKTAVKEPPAKPAKTEPRALAITPKGKEVPTKKDHKKEAKKTKDPEPDPEPTPAKSAKSTAAPSKSTIKLADTKHLVSRQSEINTQAREKADADARARARADEHAAQFARQQLATKMKSIIGGLQGGLSAPVDVQVDAGGGPNALAFLDYGQTMVRLYEQMWLAPPNLSEAHAVVSVTVTVARDGRVISWRVSRPTGNAAVDKSVRETLEKVRQFEAFPASFRESQRTFNIDFNLKAKRSSG